MTSPARSISTVSPTRMSLRRISSSLWRLTLRMVTPASSTGSSLATGVSVPVLPTWTSIDCTTVGACRRVAGVGERRLAGVFEAPVELLELGARHEDLAADFDLTDRGETAAQRHREASDRPEVLCDLLADAAVPAGGAPHEAAVLVEQGDTQAVDLRLAHVAEARPGQCPVQARLELAKVLGRRRVVEREHRHFVLDGPDRVHWAAGDALGGAVRGDELGERRLEVGELAPERVVLAVRDFRPRLDVIGVIVVADRLAQLRQTPGGVRPIHGGEDNTSGGLRTIGATSIHI